MKRDEQAVAEIRSGGSAVARIIVSPGRDESVAEMIRDHEPDQDSFRAVLPEDIDWQPFAAFPRSVRLAALAGHPRGPNRYVIR